MSFNNPINAGTNNRPPIGTPFGSPEWEEYFSRSSKNLNNNLFSFLVPPNYTQNQINSLGTSGLVPGSIVYNTDTNRLNYWNSSMWVEV